MKDQTDKKGIFSEWLEKLQQESWQLELLISGFALFGIWESRGMLRSFTDYIAVNSPLNSDAIVIFKVFGLMLMAAWLVFFINLLVHVILRGLWIGAIGLRYVSGDIDYESLNFSKHFTQYFKKKVGYFDDYIERLEKVCSVIFAYTFLLFFIFLSSALFIVITFVLIRVIDFLIGFDSSAFPILLIAIFLFLAFFVFIDFITLGAFKKIQNKSFSKGYAYIYRFYSFITFSFIYRPLLYNFIDYKYTRRLFWFSIPYVFIITIIVPGFFLEANPYFPSFKSKNQHFNRTSRQIVSWNNYDDLRETNLAISGDKRRVIKIVSLSSQEITGSHAKVFLRQMRSDEDLLAKKYGISPYKKSGLQNELWGSSKKDTVIIDLENQRSVAVLKILKTHKRLKKNKDSLNTGIKNDFMRGFNSSRYEKSILDVSEYVDFKIDSTKAYWNQKIEEAKENKILKIKNALMAANKISIDGIPYNKHISCKFYVHPNLKEKGLLCYFPVDSLKTGEHILTLNRSTYAEVFQDSINTLTINIPFWKINK